MNGAAGSSKSQASKADSRIGFSPKGRRIYEEPWQMDVGRSNRGWRVGPRSEHSPGSRIQGRHWWAEGLHSSVPRTGICVGQRLLRRRLLGPRTLELRGVGFRGDRAYYGYVDRDRRSTTTATIIAAPIGTTTATTMATAIATKRLDVCLELLKCKTCLTASPHSGEAALFVAANDTANHRQHPDRDRE